MHPPAVAASRLLLGAGVGGFLAVGLDLQNGGWAVDTAAFAVVSVSCLLLGWTLRRGMGPMTRVFSSESDDEMAQQVKHKLEELEASEDVNAKWAALEAKVLSDDLTQSSDETDPSVD